VTPNRRRARANAMLLLAAAIWGFTFVAQRLGARHVAVFSFNAVRFAIGAALLIAVVAVLDRRRCLDRTARRAAWRAALGPGLATGVVLSAAAGFQQAAMVHTTAGNAAFVTGLYMVLVPLAGVARGRRIGWQTLAGIGAATGGLYLLSVTGGLHLRPGDGLVMLSAVGFACQILAVDHYAGRVSALRFSIAQFIGCTAVSTMAALAFDAEPFAGLQAAWLPLAYSGLLSVGVAYTVQVIAQRDAMPTHAALIMSTEAVFGALGGALLLGENMGLRGYCGAAAMLIGIVVSQLGAGESRRAPKLPIQSA
jgi:drug/metabolite transporter (DMT)-like permease